MSGGYGYSVQWNAGNVVIGTNDESGNVLEKMTNDSSGNTNDYDDYMNKQKYLYLQQMERNNLAKGQGQSISFLAQSITQLISSAGYSN